MINPQNNTMTVEDAANVLEAQLTNLELTDDELDGIKGGTRPGSEDGGGGIGGDWIINHNEMTVSDPEEDAQFDDLELTDDESDGIKGGTRTGADDGGGGRSGGDWIINHNEMILRDE